MPLQIFSNFRDPKTDPLFEYLREKYSDKPISIHYEYFPSLQEININPYNFSIIMEPNEFFRYHDIAVERHHIFTAILTWSPIILDKCSNTINFTFYFINFFF